MHLLFKNEITARRFAAFIVPSMVLEIVLALYYTIDTLSVSLFAGKVAMATLSLAYPVIGIMWGLSVMLACGSSAIVAIKMGEGKQKEANQKFTLIFIVSLFLAAVLITCALLFMGPITKVLGASGELADSCARYLKVLVWGFPFAFIQVLVEFYVRVDGKPGFTLGLSVLSGAVHIAVNFLLMGVFGWGIEGAAVGTICGSAFAATFGILYFFKNSTLLKFTKPKFDGHFILHTFTNGSSEFVNEASEGINTYVFNLLMLHIAGTDGVAAMSIVFSLHYLIGSMHVGYVAGLEPLISYFYGAKDYKKVNRCLRYSNIYIAISAIVATAVFFLLAPLMAMPFADPGTHVYELAVVGIRLVAPSFLFCGISVFGGGFFTAYGNGQISAIISSSRSLVTIIVFAVVLSMLFGINGLWLATAAAEAVTALLTVFMIRKYKDRYHYSFGNFRRFKHDLKQMTTMMF